MAVLTILLCSIHASAATVYVNNVDGDDTNDGRSAERAFATIAKAVAACGTSDTLVLANTGTAYRESIQLIGKGGTPAKPFVIEGNGATITGLDPIPADAWEKLPDGKWLLRTKPIEIYDNFAKRKRPIRQFLCEKKIKLAKDAVTWTDDGIVIATAPANRDFTLTVRESGLEIVNASYIVCRNLIAEGFHNDGFNVHGECDAIRCENICARYNGDDGFSIHEAITAIVVGGYFHHNDNGIQDVNASRSSYFGVLVTDNRIHGIHLRGGQRLLIDVVSRSNASDQVLVEGGNAKHLGLGPDDLATACRATLRNVETRGGPLGLRVGKRGTVVATNCIFAGAERCVEVSAGGALHLTHSAVLDTTKYAVALDSDEIRLDHNVYWPAQFRCGERTYRADQWDAWRKDTGLDAGSSVSQPVHDILLRPHFRTDAEPPHNRVGPTQHWLKSLRGIIGRE